MKLMTWLEALPVSVWVRESASVFAYSGVLFLHTMGLGILVGANIAVALLALRSRPDETLAPLASYYKYAWIGFWLNAISGTLLVVADATTKLTNPVFYIKMLFVVLALRNMILLRRCLTPSGLTPKARLYAALSVTLWLGAITAGRLMAYLGPVSGAPELMN